MVDRNGRPLPKILSAVDALALALKGGRVMSCREEIALPTLESHF
jgi:hypothetical protein